MIFKTPDLCDAFESELGKTVRVVAPMFQRYGGRTSFSGQIVTLKIFEDNALVREIFGEAGHGKVLVIDGGGSLRCALIGDQLAILAAKNGWAGAIVYGCIRDSGDINGIDLGIRALNTHPQKTLKKGVGDKNIAVTFGGVTFNPGEYLYADEDGVLVSNQPLC
ncbi:MAG TPA: ribonuclease E activity regulator RraA [Azonexus sp.]|nr:ribonuclease E activity regulator RraA [Azonexus sp.]